MPDTTYRLPNLYEFATKELDQDATLAYILDWARPEIGKDSEPDSHDGRMHRLGRALLRALVRSHPARDLKAWSPDVAEAIEVTTQENRIDVRADIETSDGKLILLIEDKTFTKERKGQIEGYVKETERQHPFSRIIPVYVKTGNESPRHLESRLSVKECGVFGRSDLLRVLDAHPQIGNRIVDEFRTYWHGFEQETRSYAEKTPSEWTRRECEGYYADLERGLEAERVHAWWHSDTIRNVDTYLHLFCDQVHRPWDGMNVRIQIRCDGKGLHELGVQAFRDKAKTDSATLRRLFREYTQDANLLGLDAHLDKPGSLYPGAWPKLSIVRFDGPQEGRGSYLALDRDGRVNLKRTVEHIVRVYRFLEGATKRIERRHGLMESVEANIDRARADGRLPGWHLDPDGNPINRLRLHRTGHWTQERFNGVWLNLWEPQVLLGVEWPRASKVPQAGMKAWFAEALSKSPEAKRGGRRGKWTTYWPVEVCRIREVGGWDDEERERFASEQAERLIALAAVIDRAEGRIP